jgi:hypothetical protein
MPPSGKLPDAVINDFVKWISLGAPDPRSEATPMAEKNQKATAKADPKDQWSFKHPQRTAPPTVTHTAAARTDVDRFILARVEAKGLSPSPQAPARALYRRLYYDLIGLPPTAEELDAFAADPSDAKYEATVDRLLASPRFGERWARHWLDVVRFAESDGFETNQPRPNAWHYRDYVIRAFNDNVPYDRFVREQLAGDALGADAATGFLVAGAYDQVKSPDEVLTRQQRSDELHDIAATVGSTFLGLTVGCARCHHHKFDPITHTDYYAFVAAFAGVHHGDRPFEQPADKEKRLARVAELRHERDELDRQADEAEPLAQPQGPSGRFTIESTNNLEPCIDELEVFASGEERRNVALASLGVKATSSGNYSGADIHKLEHINDGRYGNARSWISNEMGRGWVQLELPTAVTIDRIVWARDREGKFKDRLPTTYRIEVAVEPGEWTVVASSADRQPFDPSKKSKAPSTLDAKRADLEKRLKDAENVPAIYAGTFSTPDPTFRLFRGDPMQRREPVAPAGLSAVSPPLKLPADMPDRERRLALANWITDRGNPLTARVMVNRLWHYHFGRGLVDTPSDLGRHGGVPSHPELIDWLAAEFMEHDWDIKHIHRLIVTSAAYRQSSAATKAGLAADAQDRLLWRYPPRRLEAETIRDAILAVSGALDRTMGGPGFDLFEPNTNYVKVYNPKTTFGPTEFRRMIYQARPRMQPDDTFGGFDCPDAGQTAPRRTVSTTPLQALNLLNSPFLLQQSEIFAKRLQQSSGDATEQLRLAFRLAFGREATESEQTAAENLIREHGLPAFCRALFNANEFLFVN